MSADSILNEAEKPSKLHKDEYPGAFTRGDLSACVITQLQIFFDRDYTNYSLTFHALDLFVNVFFFLSLIFFRCVNLSQKPDGVSPGLPDSPWCGGEGPQSPNLSQTLRLPSVESQFGHVM